MNIDSMAGVVPGNRLALGGLERTVVTVLRCSEALPSGRTTWTWAFLDDGSLLEVAPRGVRRYQHHRVLDAGGTFAQQLVARDGALIRFEARVRAGREAAEPTIVSLDGREYRIAATGNISVDERLGPPPTLGAWSTLGDAARDDVFAVLEPLDGRGAALALWTHVLCFSLGEPLEEASLPADS